jgi:IS5 family transposase
MSIIPPFVQNLITTYLAPLLEWFSERIYVDLIGRAPGHLLVKLCQHLDLAPLEAACAPFHHDAGPGRPAEHTVPRLVRALLVKYLCDLSLREAESEIRFHLLVKWFVGYPVFAPGPDHSTLERFEQWVCQHQRRAFFDQVLHQIDRAFPEQRQQTQIGDTFAMHANAAREPLIPLIRHLCRRLLRALEQADADRAQHVCQQLDDVALFGPDNEVDEYYLSPEKRAERLRTTVCAALDCASLVRSALDPLARVPLCAEARAPVLEWLDLLDKAIADDVQITHNEQGQITQVSERPDKEKGSYRLGSATDPDATYRVHGKKVAFGYNVSVAVNDQFVREIQADSGAQPDNVAVPDLIQAQQEHHDLTPSKLLYDAAAGSGKTRALVNQVSDGQTQLSAPLLPYNKRTTLFTPDHFQLSEDGRTLTCPNGLTSSVSYPRPDLEGRWFRFYARQCRGCPLWAQCRDHKPNTKAHRVVFISDFRSEVDAAAVYNQSDAYKADRKLRPKVEQVIAHLVRYNGARHARRRGKLAADFQAKMCATAYNLKRWMRLLSARSGSTASQPATTASERPLAA